MDRIPAYATSVTKAQEVILWLATHCPQIDVYHLVKAAYFADKHHVAQYGRPIVGDRYQAAPWGPLPQVIYGLIRREPIEMLALGGNGDVQFEMDQAYQIVAKRAPNLRMLSESDEEALRHGLDRVRGRSFDDLFRETHADPAYINASGGLIDYRDMIPVGDPDRREKQEFIAQNAAAASL